MLNQQWKVEGANSEILCQGHGEYREGAEAAQGWADELGAISYLWWGAESESESFLPDFIRVEVSPGKQPNTNTWVVDGKVFHVSKGESPILPPNLKWVGERTVRRVK